MATAASSPSCPFCQQPLSSGDANCPKCRVSAAWFEPALAVDFAASRFEQWHKQGRLSDSQNQVIQAFYKQRRQTMAVAAQRGDAVPADFPLPPQTECWSCRETSTDKPGAGDPYCPGCGAPVDHPAVRSLRLLTYLCHDINSHETMGRIYLAQAHEFLGETKERMEALERRLEKDRAPLVTAVDEAIRAAPAAPPPKMKIPARPLWEILLDPRTIQWLLGFGGALLVIGLVIWLWAAGIFENPFTKAVLLGLGNGVLLAGGWAVIHYTRYQTAGRALTLLACLVMPLNLWFYDRNGLVVLDQGGHLWLAALVCCVLYAASALVLRDPAFVYVLVGGVAMTGLLILADRTVNQFWEIASPATLLVVLGLICVHTERAFPEGDGPFSRQRFGLAFFWAGQVALAGGLVLLLGAQLAGWMFPIYKWGLEQRPAIITDPALQWLALALVIAGTYAYLYSDIVVRRVGLYVYVAIFTLLWGEVLVINLFHLGSMEVVITALAVTALAANLTQSFWMGDPKLSRAAAPLGLFLSTVPVILGIVLHLRASNRQLHGIAPYDADWSYVGAMLATAVSCRVGAHLYRHTRPQLSAWYFFGTAAATLVGAAALLVLLGLRDWSGQAPLLMLIPIAYLVAARLYRGHTAEQPILWAAHVATEVMVIAVLAAALHITEQVFDLVTGKTENLLLALFFAEATVFYALAAVFTKKEFNITLGTATACGAVWQLMLYWDASPESYILVFAALGLLLLIGYRLAVLERMQRSGLAAAAFQSANALLSLAFLAGVLRSLARLATEPEQIHWGQVSALIVLTIISLLAAWLVQQQSWRRWYTIMAIGDGLLIGLCIHVLSHLTAWQKMEIFCIAVGLLLLVVGHIGWYREQERHSDTVSLSLFLGSVLTGLPLLIAVLYYRSPPNPDFSIPNELGLLVVSVLLVGTGVVLQLKATTVIGSSLLGLYLLTMVLFIQRIKGVQTMALWLAIGGGLIFTLGLLLSIYRDRLVTLPERIKRREGVFRVLGWR